MAVTWTRWPDIEVSNTVRVEGRDVGAAVRGGPHGAAEWWVQIDGEIVASGREVGPGAARARAEAAMAKAESDLSRSWRDAPAGG